MNEEPNSVPETKDTPTAQDAPAAQDPPATLDPPGSIVVLGTTAIGIEAALYGRYLGYNVTLIAGADVWRRRDSADTDCIRIGPTFNEDWFAKYWLNADDLAQRWDEAMPMMPDRCLSPLAFGAIEAQREEVPSPLPSSMREWVDGSLAELIETDLLRGRVFADTFVQSIELMPVSIEEDDQDSEDDYNDVPPDFLLKLHGAPISRDGETQLQCECVIVADISMATCELGFDLPADYFFHVDQKALMSQADSAEMLRTGWQQIAAIYAQLADRPGLDLYRPQRV